VLEFGTPGNCIDCSPRHAAHHASLKKKLSGKKFGISVDMLLLKFYTQIRIVTLLNNAVPCGAGVLICNAPAGRHVVQLVSQHHRRRQAGECERCGQEM
jgi:hypothetical protein